MEHTNTSMQHRLDHFIKGDIMLNVSLKESFIRGLGAIFILVPSLTFTDHRILYFSIPMVAYLYITALSHFDIIRYAWRHWLHHETDPLLPDLPPELYVPEAEPEEISYHGSTAR